MSKQVKEIYAEKEKEMSGRPSSYKIQSIIDEKERLIRRSTDLSVGKVLYFWENFRYQRNITPHIILGKLGRTKLEIRPLNEKYCGKSSIRIEDAVLQFFTLEEVTEKINKMKAEGKMEENYGNILEVSEELLKNYTNK